MQSLRITHMNLQITFVFDQQRIQTAKRFKNHTLKPGGLLAKRVCVNEYGAHVADSFPILIKHFFRHPQDSAGVEGWKMRRLYVQQYDTILSCQNGMSTTTGRVCGSYIYDCLIRPGDHKNRRVCMAPVCSLAKGLVPNVTSLLPSPNPYPPLAVLFGSYTGIVGSMR